MAVVKQYVAIWIIDDGIQQEGSARTTLADAEADLDAAESGATYTTFFGAVETQYVGDSPT